jgi:hypothetical protein
MVTTLSVFPLNRISGVFLQLSAALLAPWLLFVKAVALASFVASLEGFEPTTRCLEGSRSIQLSYRDNQIKYSMMGLE